MKKNIEKNNLTIVDFGGGTGGLFDDFLHKDNIVIIDFDKYHLNYANERGFKTICGGLEKLENLEIIPDLIILSHVFEHLFDLDKVIKILKKICSEKTLLYIEVPSLEYFYHGSGAYGYDYRKIFAKYHNYYFTEAVINNMFNKNGFQTIKSDYFSRNLFINNNKYIVEKNFYKQSLFILYKLNFLRKYYFFKQLIKKIIYFKF